MQKEQSESSFKQERLNPRYLTITIPTDWSIAKLGTLIVEHKAGIFKNQSDYGFGHNIVGVADLYRHHAIDGQIFSLVKLSEEERSEYALKEGDLVYAESSLVKEGIAKTLPVMKNGEGTVFAWHTRKIRVNEKLNPHFLYYLMDYLPIRMSLISRSTTTALTGITVNEYFNTKLPIPPIKEQQKIAYIFSKVDGLIQKSDKAIELTQRLKKGVMQKLLTKGITHIKFKEIVLFPKYITMNIPDEWRVVTFGDIANRITYGFTNPMPHMEEGPWLITAKDIKDGKINYHTAEKTSQKDYEELLTDKSRPKVGTVLITKDGTLGEVAIVDRNNVCINQSVASIEPKSIILSDFLALILQSSYIKKVIDAFSPATTIRHISITDLDKWKFGLPSINEQRKIVLAISYIDKYLQRTKNGKLVLQRFKQGLMQKLLTGQKRVGTVNF